MTHSPRFWLCIILTAIGLIGSLAGCMSNASRYSDRQILFAPTEKLAQKQQAAVCNTNDVQQAQNNPACIGKVLRGAPNGGTITILKPGIAVPPADVDMTALDAPQR
jgi:hypothetical protein